MKEQFHAIVTLLSRVNPNARRDDVRRGKFLGGTLAGAAVLATSAGRQQQI